MDHIPYMVLSVKTAGVGLNLTRANHVIHFDRWWNPAVENQATDRAFRIGQDKNVVVHTCIIRGTVEDKIDRMIAAKVDPAESIVAATGENWIIEMDNEVLEIRETEWWTQRNANRAGHLLAGSRLKLGMAQAELGEKTGLTASVISAYENGRRKISGKAALRLAPVLDLSPDELPQM